MKFENLLIIIMLFLIFIPSSISVVDAENKNMTISSDTSLVYEGSSQDITFTVLRPCNPDEECASIYPPIMKPQEDAQVSLTGSVENTGTTDDNGKVTFSVNPTSSGLIYAAASKEGYNNVMTSIPVIPNSNSTPLPTPNPTYNITPVPTFNITPTPTSNSTPVPTSNVTPIPTTNVTPVPTSICSTKNVNMENQTSFESDSHNFGLDFTSTKMIWNVTWSVNNSIIKSESNVTSISEINSVGKIGTVDVIAHSVNNSCIVVNYIWTWTVIQKPPSPSSGNGNSGSGGSGGSSTGGSSGGGGSVSTLEPYNNIDFHMSEESDITSREPTSYLFDKLNFSIYEIDVYTKTNDVDVNLRLEHLKNVSRLANKQPAGVIYSSENVWTNSKRIDYVVVKFKVLNLWIKSNNFENQDIKLLKYDGNWWKLNTNITKSDSSYTYYEALSPLSYVYSISGLKDNIKLSNSMNISHINQTNQNNNNLHNSSLGSRLRNLPNDRNLQIIGLTAIIIAFIISVLILRSFFKISSRLIKERIRKIIKEGGKKQ